MSSEIKAPSPLTSVTSTTFNLIDSEEMNREVKWHASWCKHYWDQGGTGVVLAALEIIPLTLLLIPAVNVITYVALSILYPNTDEAMLKSCMDQGNATGSYILTEWGVETTLNENSESLLDMFANKGIKNEGFSKQDLAICHTLLKQGVHADFSHPGFTLLLEAAANNGSHELVIALMNEGVKDPKTFPAPTKKLEDRFNQLHPFMPLTFTPAKDLTFEAIDENSPLLPSVENTLQSLIRITEQKDGNCPLFVTENRGDGEAVAKALALKIAYGEVPESLQGKRLASFDLSEIEDKIYPETIKHSLMQKELELLQNPNLIFYVDNFDVFSTFKRDTTSVAIRYMQKLASRGRIILSMTPAEYKTYSKDLIPAYTKLEIPSFNSEETLFSLSEKKDDLEKKHGVFISDRALKSAIFMSRYIQDASLPETPLSILNEAAALLKEQNSHGSFPLHDAMLRRKELQFNVQYHGLGLDISSAKKLAKSQTKLENVEKEIEELKKQDQEDLALRDEFALIKQKLSYLRSFPDNLQTEVAPLISQTERDLSAIEAKLKQGNFKFEVDRQLIARIVSEKANLPLSHIQSDEAKNLLNLDKRLAEEVMGQDLAIREVVECVKRARTGFRDESKPQGVYIFAGPTGVGKTELSKALALNLFGDKKNMVRIDMAELSDKHDKSRIGGAPPGYVGYTDGGQLTEALKRNPYTLVLLDEIEECDPVVLKQFLTAFDEGYMTDAHGNRVDVSKAMIVGTTNVGAEELVENEAVWMNKQDPVEVIKSAMREFRHFPPKMENRVTVVPFFPLDRLDVVKKIAHKQLTQVQKRAEGRHNIEFTWTDRAETALAKQGRDKHFGARPMERLVDRVVNSGLANMYIKGELKEGDRATLDYTHGRYTIKAETI